MKRLILHIDGMSCGHCLNSVNQALSQVPGTRIVSVGIGRAEVEYDQSRTTPGEIAGAVATAGYPATPAP